MELVQTMNPEVKKAVDTLVPLLRSMTTTNLGQTMDEIDVIRQGLHGEQDELQVVAILISLGEI